MKKFFLSLVAAMSLFSACAFADTQPTTGYTSTQFRHTKLTASAVSMVMPTNIVFINESDYNLHVVIPGTPINQALDSGGTALITHPSYAGKTHVFIMKYDQIKFDMDFCHRSIVTIDGGPDVFRLNANDTYC